MKKILFTTSLSAFPIIAYAQIDVGSALGGALITIAIRGAIAFGLFKLITRKLTRKTTFTPMENGRWVGAWLLGASLISFQSSNKSTEDFYFGIILVSIVWFLVGFVIGFVWRKLRPLNKIGDSIEGLGTANRNIDEPQYWEQASEEFNSDGRNKALWTKLFAQYEGDAGKAEAAYLRQRFEELSKKNVAPRRPLNTEVKDKPFSPLKNEYLFTILVAIVFVLFAAYKLGAFDSSFIKSTPQPTYSNKAASNSQPDIQETSEGINKELRELNLKRGIKNIQLLNAHKRTLQQLSDVELKEVIVVSEAQKNADLIRAGKLTLDQLTLKQLYELKAMQQAYDSNTK